MSRGGRRGLREQEKWSMRREMSEGSKVQSSEVGCMRRRAGGARRSEAFGRIAIDDAPWIRTGPWQIEEFEEKSEQKIEKKSH